MWPDGVLIKKIKRKTWNLITTIVLGQTEDSHESNQKLKVAVKALSNEECRTIVGAGAGIVDSQVKR